MYECCNVPCRFLTCLTNPHEHFHFHKHLTTSCNKPLLIFSPNAFVSVVKPWLVHWTWDFRRGVGVEGRWKWFGSELNLASWRTKCDYVTESWGLGPHHWKASKQTRLVERKVCFILDAGNGGGGGQMSVQKWTPPSTDNQGGKNIYRLREGAICRNSTVHSDDHFQVSHWWSDQLHLDCFKYS